MLIIIYNVCNVSMNICLTIYYNYVYTQLPKRLQYEIKDDANQYEASM